MKKEITPSVYESTIVYLDNRIRIYGELYEAVEKKETRERYEQLIQDCREIRSEFMDAFTPRKRRSKRRSSQKAEE